MTRRLEFREGTSAKFWEVWVTDASMFTRWGRIGSVGQSKEKQCEAGVDERRLRDLMREARPS